MLIVAELHNKVSVSLLVFKVRDMVEIITREFIQMGGTPGEVREINSPPVTW